MIAMRPSEVRERLITHAKDIAFLGDKLRGEEHRLASILLNNIATMLRNIAERLVP